MTRKSSEIWTEIRQGTAVLLCLVMVVSMFAGLAFIDNAEGHIPEGEGNPLQLYSYFDSDASTKISISDSGIARDIGNYDEWEGSYVRNITLLSPSYATKYCYLFLANDDVSLYVGLIYQGQSSSANDYVTLYFDEGDGTGAYDGTHDDTLTAGNEQKVQVGGQGGGLRYWDGYWNGASWVNDNNDNNNGPGPEDDFDFQTNFGNSFYNWEIIIPLDPKPDSGIGSDLNVGSTDELGFFLEVFDNNAGESFFWELTGNDATDVNSYADLRLGLTKKDSTVYSTYANTGNPTIDGDIAGDFAYANAYSRDMTLTNFTGGTIKATMYTCEDPIDDDIFIALVIYIDSSDPSDFLRIYTDQNHNVGPPYGNKDGVLSAGGGQTENYEQINGDNSYSDGFWDGGGAWLDDSAGADAKDGEGAVTFVNFPGTTYDRYEFEFRLPYSLNSSYQANGALDLWINSPQIQGFLIEFYVASATPGEQYFYWDLTTNLNSIQTEMTGGGIYVSTGWAYLQTGGPALKPITPITGSTVFGTDYIFRVEAEDEDGFDGVNFVGFQIEGQTNWISLVRDSPLNGIWFTYWDTTALPDGKYNITVVAQDNEGIAVKKIITVTIANGATLNIPPTVSLNSPSTGSTVSGTVTFQATTTGIASVVEFHLDGLLIGTMSSIGLESWQYLLDTTNWDDGMHVVNLVAKNAAGEASDGGVYIFDNWDLNSLTITQPASGSIIRGTVNILGNYETDGSGDYAELYIDDALWATNNMESDLGGGDEGYTFSIDTTLLADKSYTIKMLVYDPDGNTAMDIILVTIDNLMSLDITQPTSGSSVNGPINVIGDFEADTSGVHAELYIDGELYDSSDVPSDIGGGNMGYSFALDTDILSEGSHMVKMMVFDLGGNYVMDMVIIVVDNHLPDSPQIASIFQGQFINGVYTFQIQAQDGDLSGVDLTIIDEDMMSEVVSNITMGYNSASGYYEYTLDTTALEDGNYTVIAYVEDAAGNPAASTPIGFKIDNSAPTLAVSSPLDNAIVSGDVDFEYTAEDTFLAAVMYKIDGNSWVDINTTWDTTTFSDGNHVATIKAMDESGHYTMVTLNLVVDNTAPEVAILNPVENQFLHDDFTFRIRAEDDVGLSDVRITIQNLDTTEVVVDDISIILNEVSGHYEYTMDTMTLEDGNYSIMATSYDVSGKDSEDVTVNFMVDNNAPMLMLISPLNGHLLTGAVTIDADYSDVFLVDMVYRVDGGAWIDLATPWDTSGVTDGEHTIEIKLTDESGQMTTQTVTVQTDNNPPDLFIVSWPTENVASSFHFQVFAKDAVELVKVSYQVGNLSEVMMFENKATGFYEAEIVTDSSGLDLEDKEYDVIITATDSVGLSNTETKKVTVDNSGPIITFEEPTDGEKIKGDWKFMVTLSDDTGIDSVFIRIDKNKWREMKEENGKYVYTWNTRTVYNGKYDIDVKAVDTLGNENEESIVVKVDNFPLLGVVIFLVGLILFLVLMVVSWTRGSKPKKKAKKKEEPTTSFEDLEAEKPQEGAEEAEIEMGGEEEAPDDLGELPPPKSEEEL